MLDIKGNCKKFLERKYQGKALIIEIEKSFHEKGSAKVIFSIYFMIALDSESGMKQKVIAMLDTGHENSFEIIANHADQVFAELDKSLFIRFSNSLQPTGHNIDITQMTFPSKIILYINETSTPYEHIIKAFGKYNLLVEIKIEKYASVFISYGSTDEALAQKINNYLVSKGVTTYFFPFNAEPGEKLHRLMSNGINNYDKVLLICSEKSLNRPGVLNEIERALEREATEGGSSILLPIRVDDFIFNNDWIPQGKQDIARQIRARVITKINPDEFETPNVQQSLERILSVLTVN